MSVLITGGCGFIGFHLCKYYLSQNYKVYCLDNLQSSNDLNLRELKENDNFNFIWGDVKQNFEIPTVQMIYHLACPAAPDIYQIDPVDTLLTCVIGTKNMLDLALKFNAKILFTSTSEVYGDPLETPQKEDYRGNVSCVGKRSCYDEGKRAAETLCFDYRRKYNCDIRVVRIFNTYGPRMNINDGRILTNFLKCRLKNQPFSIYGDGNQTRTLCYITDTVYGLLRMMEVPNPEVPINIGGTEEKTVKEIAHLVHEITSGIWTEEKLEYYPLPKDDPKQRKPDISQAKKILNWEPEIKLEDGIKMMWESLKEL